MTSAEDDLNAMLDAAAGLLGLTVSPPWRSEVLTHMKVIAGAARMLGDFPLEEDTAPAPVFRP
jgi:hypothetical protein